MRSGRLRSALPSVPATKPACTAIVSQAASPGVSAKAATIGAVTAVAENHIVMPSSSASETSASMSLGMGIPGAGAVWRRSSIVAPPGWRQAPGRFRFARGGFSGRMQESGASIGC